MSGDLALVVAIDADMTGLSRALADSKKGLEITTRAAGVADDKLNKLGADGKIAGGKVAEGAKVAADGLGKIGNAAKGAADGIKDVSKAAGQAKAALAGIGVSAGVAFAGLSIPIVQAVKAFAAFEAELQGIQAVSGTTGAELDHLKAQALALGASTKFSATEAAAGMRELAAAGMTAMQISAAIPGVLALAAAGGVSIAEAATLAGGALNGFGLAADQAGRVADVMAQAASRSAVSIGDLSLTMKYVSSIASTAGQSLEQMSGAVAIMGNSMVKGEQAGTSMRSALVRLLDPPREAATAMHKLRISIQDTHGKMLPFGQIIDQIRTKTAAMTETQRAATLSQIFGTEALSGMSALVKASPGDYAAMVAAMKASEGAAQRMADVMNKGLAPALEQMGGAIDTMKSNLGEAFAPSVMAAAGAVQSLANSFGSMPAEAQAFAAGLLAFSAAGAGITTVAAGALVATPAIIAGSTAMLTMAGSAATLTLFLVPTTAALVLLSAAVGGAVYALSAAAIAEHKAAIATETARQERLKAVTTNMRHRETLEQLVKEHDNLADKTHRSKEESKRLITIQDQLKAQFPALAKAIGTVGLAHIGNLPGIDAERHATDKLIASKLLEARISAGRSRSAATSAGIVAGEAERAAEDLRKGTPMGMGRLSVATRIGAAQELRRKSDLANKQATADEAAAKELAGITKPAVATDNTAVGKIVDAPHSAGGNSAASKAAALAKKAREEELKNAKANADATGALREALDERMLAAQKASNAHIISQLEYMHSAGLISERDYLLELEALKLEEIEIDHRAAAGKLAAAKASARAVIAAKPDKDEVIAARGKLAALAVQEKANDDQRASRRVAVATDTEHKLTAAAQVRFNAAFAGEKALEDATTERAALEGQASRAKLTGVKATQAAAEAEHAEAVAAAEKAYQATTEQIALDYLAVEPLSAQAGAAGVLARARMDEAEAAKKARIEIANTGKETKARDIAKQTTAEITDMADALIGLAANPSLENLGGFADRLASNPGEILKMVDAIKAVWSAAAGGAEGLGELAKKQDGVAVAAWLAAKAVDALFWAINRNGQKEVRAVNTGLSASLMEINAQEARSAMPAIDAATARVAAYEEALKSLRDVQYKTKDAGVWQAMADEIARLAPGLGAAREAAVRLADEAERLAAAVALATTENLIRVLDEAPIKKTEDTLAGLRAELVRLATEQSKASVVRYGDEWLIYEADIQHARGAIKQTTADLEALHRAQAEQGIKNRVAFGVFTPLEGAQADKSRLEGEQSKAIDTLGAFTSEDQEGWEDAKRAVEDFTNQVERARGRVLDLTAAETAAAQTIADVAAEKAKADEEEKRDNAARAAGIEKIIALREQLNKGETDDRGELVSLHAKRDLDLEAARAGWRLKAAEYAEKEAKAQKDLAKLKADEAKAVQAILDEGIAVREKSESQDKTERIAAVRLDYAEKTKTLETSMKAMTTERQAAEDAHADTLARIEAIANRRIIGLQAELRTIEDVTRNLYTNIEQYGTMEGAIAAVGRALESVKAIGTPAGSLNKPAPGRTSSGQKSGFSGGEYTGDALRAKFPGMGFHAGGVQDREGAAMVLRDEMILTKAQQGALFDLLSYRSGAGLRQTGASSSGGSVNVGDVSIAIMAAPGQSPQAIGEAAGRAAWAYIDKRLRSPGAR